MPQCDGEGPQNLEDSRHTGSDSRCFQFFDMQRFKIYLEAITLKMDRAKQKADRTIKDKINISKGEELAVNKQNQNSVLKINIGKTNYRN